MLMKPRLVENKEYIQFFKKKKYKFKLHSHCYNIYIFIYICIIGIISHRK